MANKKQKNANLHNHLDGKNYVVLALWVTRCSESRNDVVIYSEDTEDITILWNGLTFLQKRVANTERHFDKIKLMRYYILCFK